MANFVNRILRAARLDVALYEEVEADRQALAQAMAVVVLSSAAAGIGGGVTNGVRPIIAIATLALVLWYVWAFLTYVIGTRLLPAAGTRADLGQLLRTTGFSSAPGVLRVVGIIPILRGPVMLLTAVWMLVAMVIAVRQALDYKSTGRAVAVCIVGWLVQALVIALLFIVFPGRAD